MLNFKRSFPQRPLGSGLQSPPISSHPFPPSDPEIWPLLSVMSLLSPFISDLFYSLFLI